ncbi:hypothetical protein GMORB2_3879 [Geosmithia morbida]|uniref:Uncharacterized protein n=1 Tax=Geosmithia morbida TaxID=1094350 RepID=A0A9P4YY61_9HYPO|nr:uncharacterized protein GMORB2_3879 [Geosmithia morbida]KAF4125040.1 hypothetical protein GMORB2_3879 [Geosmithia morbida]
MPTYFQFTQGTESRVRPNSDASPLLGRYRAVPTAQQGSLRVGRRSSRWGLFSGGGGGGGGGPYSSLRAAGYGAVLDAGGFGDDDDDDDDGGDVDDLDDLDGSVRARLWRRWVLDLWVRPRNVAVKRVVDHWYSRYGLLVFMPALLTIAWCAIPLPQYRLPDGYGGDGDDGDDVSGGGDRTPGHGRARVQVNFWFFLFVYYGLYNLTALIWITKLFNLYSLNWWPQSLGFPATVSLIAIVSLAVPIPIYYMDSTRFLTMHNTAWIAWTFITMALPVAIALLILRNNERHIGLRSTLSETQRIFTASWWTGDVDSMTTASMGRSGRRRPAVAEDGFLIDDDDDGHYYYDDGSLAVVDDLDAPPPSRTRASRRAAATSRTGPPPPLALVKSWFPASFVRFLWFCVALFVGLMAYVLGEAYAELYLRTLPHNSFETVIYVYGWVVTVHLLDLLTGFVIGAREGERVGSYPLSWVFKLYFMLTYQTYVRALYARLRSPQQFVVLQMLSSTRLVIITPIMMTSFFHRILGILGLTTLSYATYQKLQTRNVFIRFLAENTSMIAFLGSVLVLHFGVNKDVYPYFSFDGNGNANDGDGDQRQDGYYDFNMIFWASGVTWACELVASLILRLLLRGLFGVDVGLEGRVDLAVWPELLPTCVAVTLHVLQNMLFSIIRLRFRA